MAFTSAGSPFLTLEPESPQPRDWDPITMMREFDKGTYVRSPQGPPTFSPTSERRFEELASKKEIGFQEIDEEIVNNDKELQQVDFSPQETTFLQRFRGCIFNSHSLNTTPPYIAIPVIAIATLSFGFE